MLPVENDSIWWKIKRYRCNERIDETYDPEIAINKALDTSSTEISKGVNPQGFDETKDTVIKGANVAKMAREQIEKESGKKIVSSKNARDKKALDINSGDK